jgi:uncharacterized repeat protein (TIGR03943 family)
VWLFLLILWGLFLLAMYQWGVLTKYFQANPYFYFTAAAGLLLLIAALKGVFWPSPLAGDCACDHEVEESLSEPDHDHDHECATAGLVPPCECGKLPTRSPRAPDACELHDHQHEESCACGCHGPERVGWWPLAKAILLLAVLAAPILMGLIIPFGSLNSLAAQRRGSGSFDPQTVLAAYSAQKDRIFKMEGQYRAANPLEIINLVYSRPDPDPAPPKVATILLASRPKGLPDDLFLGVRFKMTCCAADAMPVEILVRWKNAPAIEDDSWVKVLGAARREVIAGHPALVLTADEVAIQKDPPEQPYIQ